MVIHVIGGSSAALSIKLLHWTNSCTINGYVSNYRRLIKADPLNELQAVCTSAHPFFTGSVMFHNIMVTLVPIKRAVLHHVFIVSFYLTAVTVLWIHQTFTAHSKSPASPRAAAGTLIKRCCCCLLTVLTQSQQNHRLLQEDVWQLGRRAGTAHQPARRGNRS